jgi:malate dehydrogenase
MIMTKVTIVGAGNVGASAALRVADLQKDCEIVMIDIAGDFAKGKALDMSAALSLTDFSGSVVGGDDYSLSSKSDVVVITAGIARKVGMSREDLLAINAKIVGSVVSEVVKESSECIIIVVTNPLDIMTRLAYEKSGFDSSCVIGMAGVLDTARFQFEVANALRLKGFSVSGGDVKAVVLGGHGDLMLPVVSSSTVLVEGMEKKLEDLFDSSEIEDIVSLVKHGGARVVSLLKTGSAYVAPGYSIAKMVNCILTGKEEVMPCSVMLKGEYGLNDVFIGCLAKLGKKGVLEIVEMPLSESEKSGLLSSAEKINNVLFENKKLFN